MRRQRQLDTVTNATTGGGQKHPHTEVKATTHDGQKTACGRFIFPTYSEKQQILKKIQITLMPLLLLQSLLQ